jgi:hypothetical protein
MSKLLAPKSLLIVVFIALIGMQFFQPDRKEPLTRDTDEIFAVLPADEEVVALIKSSCFDCHSNNTDYPWYASASPISWWLQEQVDEGREVLNFSEWTKYELQKAAHKLEECFKEVAMGSMPLSEYTWIHGDARLSETQRARLAGWFKLSKRKMSGQTPPEQ